jgi:acetyltransferase-like isoleucine patch superfamily enzyme
MSTLSDDHDLPPNDYNPHAWVIGEPEIGEQTWIGAFTVIDGSGGLRIGSGCDISSGAQIYTHSTVMRCLNGPEVDVERAPTVLGNRVHVGAGAIVLMGSSIGDESVIGAGCVVPQFTDIPARSVVVGVPARVVGSTTEMITASDRKQIDGDD